MWKEEYVKMAFPFKRNELKIEESQNFKYKHMPQAFYRYRTFNENNIENLKNGVEWQSYPSEFNDPYDSKLAISTENFRKELFRIDIQLYLKALEKNGIYLSEAELNDILEDKNPFLRFSKKLLQIDPQFKDKSDNEIIDFASKLDKIVEEKYDLMLNKIRTGFHTGYLIICFSEVNDSIKMWSHYAQNHTGYCIEYDFKSLGPKYVRCRLIQPVIYSDNLFDATNYYIESFKDKDNHNNLYGTYPTISKSPEWEYEKEWRHIFPCGPGVSIDNKDKRLLSMPNPKRLYLGAKISEGNKEVILEVAKSKKIEVYQMNLNPNNFEMSAKLVFPPEKN